MVNKVFTDEAGNELTVFINKDWKCYIEACNDTERSGDYMGYVCLDILDLRELIQELIRLEKEMSE